MTPASLTFNAAYIDGLRRRDPAIEEHFVSYFTPILRRKLRYNLRSTDLAQDVLQETFLRVLAAVRSERSIHKPERFEIYVIGVCNHVLHENWRLLRRSAALQPLDIDLPADYPSAYAMLLAEEIQHDVQRALARLEEGKQGILQAVLMEELDKDEICRRFGVNRNYLRVLLFRAKKEFRNRTGKSWPSTKRRTPRADKSSCAIPSAIPALLARSQARTAIPAA